MASLAILGTLLVAVLMAKQRYIRQHDLAQRKLDAIAATDRLLSAWWRDPDGIPRDSRGEITDHPGLTWRTRVLSSAEAEALGTRVVRVEVSDRTDRAPDSIPTSPLVVVDLLLPQKEAADAR